VLLVGFNARYFGQTWCGARFSTFVSKYSQWPKSTCCPCFYLQWNTIVFFGDAVILNWTG
jgi:hypothetical protein